MKNFGLVLMLIVAALWIGCSQDIEKNKEEKEAHLVSTHQEVDIEL